MPVSIALLTLAVYLPTLRCGWIWDDNHHITDNIELRTTHGLGQIWTRIGATPQYYPVTYSSFWVEYHLWGLWPAGYHLDNCLLQTANAVLIGWLLTRLKIPGAWLAAAIWAVHPMQVESVAWASERKNLLSGFFYLLSMHAALRVWRLDEASSDSTRLRGMWFVSFGLFLLAILAKSVTVTLPAVILLLLWFKRRPITKMAFAMTLPFFAAALAMGSLTGWMERHVVGAMGPDWNFAPWQRLIIAGHAIWFYLGKIFFPVNESFVYAKWPLTAEQLIWPVGVLILIGIAWAARKRLGRGPLAAVLFFAGTLFPALGFANVYPMRYSFVADHFQYLASLGPIVLACAFLCRWRVSWVLVVPLIVLTEMRTAVFKDSLNLWSDALAKNPTSDLAEGKLADLQLVAGHPKEAVADWRHAIALDPGRADGFMGLGLTYAAEGRFDEAVKQLEHAESLAPANEAPPFYLGGVLAQQGKLAEAIAAYRHAARLAPNPASPLNEAGQLEMQRGNETAAAADFRAAIAADPDFTPPYDNLSSIVLEKTTTAASDQAIADCAAALAIDPDDVAANNNTGIALAREGNIAGAIEHFRAALRADPASRTARENLVRLGG